MREEDMVIPPGCTGPFSDGHDCPVHNPSKDLAPSAPEIQNMEAVRSASPQHSDWQPIETAPKDGTLVLLRKRDVIVSAHWSRGDAFSLPHWSSVYPMHEATHWMPLSALPEAK